MAHSNARTLDDRKSFPAAPARSPTTFCAPPVPCGGAPWPSLTLRPGWTPSTPRRSCCASSFPVARVVNALVFASPVAPFLLCHSPRRTCCPRVGTRKCCWGIKDLVSEGAGASMGSLPRRDAAQVLTSSSVFPFRLSRARAGLPRARHRPLPQHHAVDGGVLHPHWAPLSPQRLREHHGRTVRWESARAAERRRPPHPLPSPLARAATPRTRSRPSSTAPRTRPSPTLAARTGP